MLAVNVAHALLLITTEGPTAGVGLLAVKQTELVVSPQEIALTQ